MVLLQTVALYSENKTNSVGEIYCCCLLLDAKTCGALLLLPYKGLTLLKHVVKVNIVVPVYAMTSCWGSGNTGTPVLNLGIG